jgi:hypothetical protein
VAHTSVVGLSDISPERAAKLTTGPSRGRLAGRWLVLVLAWVAFLGSLVLLPHVHRSEGLAGAALLGRVAVLVGAVVAGRAAHVRRRRTPLGPVRSGHHVLLLLVAAAGLVAVGLWAYVLTR